MQKGWVGIHCPFPDCSDQMRHMGINRKAKTFSCWICGRKGHIETLIMEIENCSYREAVNLMARYPALFDDNESDYIAPRQEVAQNRHIEKIMPKEATKDFRHIHLSWLQSRNFIPDKIIKKYDLYSVYNSGRWRGRIIAPIYLNNQIVSYITRDTIGSSSLPYIDCPEAECLIPPKKTLYNIDSIKDGKAIIVEGITDVWRLGDGAIGSFTSNITPEQKMMLIKKGIKQLFWMYDEDAQEKARRLAHEMSAFIKIELILLDHGDPADLSQDEARELKRDLLGDYK